MEDQKWSLLHPLLSIVAFVQFGQFYFCTRVKPSIGKLNRACVHLQARSNPYRQEKHGVLGQEVPAAALEKLAAAETKADRHHLRDCERRFLRLLASLYQTGLSVYRHWRSSIQRRKLEIEQLLSWLLQVFGRSFSASKPRTSRNRHCLRPSPWRRFRRRCPAASCCVTHPTRPSPP